MIEPGFTVFWQVWHHIENTVSLWRCRLFIAGSVVIQPVFTFGGTVALAKHLSDPEDRVYPVTILWGTPPYLATVAAEILVRYGLTVFSFPDTDTPF